MTIFLLLAVIVRDEVKESEGEEGDNTRLSVYAQFLKPSVDKNYFTVVTGL